MIFGASQIKKLGSGVDDFIPLSVDQKPSYGPHHQSMHLSHSQIPRKEEKTKNPEEKENKHVEICIAHLKVRNYNLDHKLHVGQISKGFTFAKADIKW